MMPHFQAVCFLLTTGFDYVRFFEPEDFRSVYQLPNVDDGVSDEISIEAGLPFGDRVHYRAWVSPQLALFPN